MQINIYRYPCLSFFHWWSRINASFTKFDEDKLGFYDFGPHVASTPKAAEDRYKSGWWDTRQRWSNNYEV